MNAPSSERRLKALIYGNNGTGKTGFGVSAPRPLILLNEIQAIPNIRAAAQRLGRPMPEVLHMEVTEDYRRVLRAVHGDRSKPFIVMGDDGKPLTTMDPWPETLVLDSLTEALLVIADEIRIESPPRIAKDGLPVDSERFWNVFQDRSSKLIRAFRDADMNVLFLALLEDKTIGEKEEAVRTVSPQLSMRKLPGVAMAAVNVVGVTYRKLGMVIDPVTRTKEAMPTYGVITIGPDYMATKPFPPLRKTEVMNFGSWCERINGRDDGSVAPEGPRLMIDDDVASTETIDRVIEKPGAIIFDVEAPTSQTTVTTKRASASASKEAR